MRISVLHTPADEEDDDDDEDDEVALGGVLSGVVVQPAHMACVWVRFPWEGIEIEPLAICIKVSPPHFFTQPHLSSTARHRFCCAKWVCELCVYWNVQKV